MCLWHVVFKAEDGLHVYDAPTSSLEAVTFSIFDFSRQKRASEPAEHFTDDHVVESIIL